MLQSVRDFPTASRFLEMVSRFKAYAAAHGTSAEGNPSCGNRYRGLYNISLKSLGAAMKRAPEVRLEHAIEYAELLPQPSPPSPTGLGAGGGTRHGEGSVGAGYCFMDSPGNDLESIAGQVISDCAHVTQ